jgi:hypothetical protein
VAGFVHAGGVGFQFAIAEQRLACFQIEFPGVQRADDGVAAD